MRAAGASGARLGPGPAVLATLLAAFFLILLDGTMVNIAVVPIQQDLAAGYAVTQWLVSAYALAFGLLLVPAGRLGDRIGHRRLFLLGLGAFTAGSLLSGTASSGGSLVVWRAVQGAAAGTLNPAILALLQNTVPPTGRRRAFAWYGATAGLATALGPLLGGLLLQWDVLGLGWRPVFLVNIPVGVVTAALAVRVVPEHRGRGGSLDPVGVALLTGALLLLVHPLVSGRAAGWPPWTLGSLAAVVPALWTFWIWEHARLRRGRAPLVDVRLFRTRSFAAGVGMTAFYFAGFVSLQFLLATHLQLGLGRSPLEAGPALVPFAGGTALGSWLTVRLGGRRQRTLLQWGAALVMAGIAGVVAALHLQGVDVAAGVLLLPLLVGGAGSGMVVALSLTVVLAQVPQPVAGAAGGVLSTAQRIGQAIGVAVVGTVFFTAAGPTGTPAVPDALAAEFTTSAQLAATCCLAAVAVTYALTFLLPRDQPSSAASAAAATSSS